jgi:hypothetical protein
MDEDGPQAAAIGDVGGARQIPILEPKSVAEPMNDLAGDELWSGVFLFLSLHSEGGALVRGWRIAAHSESEGSEMVFDELQEPWWKV